MPKKLIEYQYYHKNWLEVNMAESVVEELEEVGDDPAKGQGANVVAQSPT